MDGLPGPRQVKGVAYLVHVKLNGWPTWSTSSQRGGLPGPRPPADCAGPASCLAAAGANSSSVPTASTGSPATACWWPHHLHRQQDHALTITYTQALKVQKREGESWGQGTERERENDDDDVHGYSTRLHWFECSTHKRRFFFSSKNKQETAN